MPEPQPKKPAEPDDRRFEELVGALLKVDPTDISKTATKKNTTPATNPASSLAVRCG